MAEGDADRADTEHRELMSLIDRAVKRGALHRNTGARKKSRAARLRAARRRRFLQRQPPRRAPPSRPRSARAGCRDVLLQVRA